MCNSVTPLIWTLYELPQRAPIVQVAQLNKGMKINYPPLSAKEVSTGVNKMEKCMKSIRIKEVL